VTALDGEKPPSPFAAPGIRTLFVDILKREQPPTDAACAEVGLVLHNMRLSFEFNRNPPPEAAQAHRCRDEVFASAENAFVPMRAALKAVEAATPELEKALAKMQTYVPTNDDLDRKFAESTATTARQMLLELGRVGEALSGYLAPLLPPKTEANDLWFEYAKTMRWLFSIIELDKRFAVLALQIFAQIHASRGTSQSERES
jgi:hypothetical protein